MQNFRKTLVSVLLVELLLKNLLIWPKTLLFYDLLIENSDFGKSLNIWSASKCWKTNQTKKKKKKIWLFFFFDHMESDLKGNKKVRDDGEKGDIILLQTP